VGHRHDIDDAKNLAPPELTLSNPIFLPPANSPALIYFGRESGWWITCNYPTVLKGEKHKQKQKEYNLRYLLAKVCTTNHNIGLRPTL
jgi:hypothetical protein